MVSQLTDTKFPAAVCPRQMHRVHLSLADSRLPVLLTCFEAGDSYTGQDMAELQCPGNPILLERVIRRSTQLGARLAEPGEFTFRAFLAGKLDLIQAEGVAATIAATSDSQLAAAGLLRCGALGEVACGLAEAVADALALVEAGIDFVDEEDVVSIKPDVLNERLRKIDRDLDGLLAQSRSWGSLDAVPRVVLVGAPSSGKSTLFNALLGHTRAITAATPGTTRDVLAEPLVLSTPPGERIEVMIFDMAGLDVATYALDASAQEAARGTIASADLVLHVQHGSVADLRSREAQEIGPEVPILRVWTKADLAYPSEGRFDVVVSAHTGHGLDALRQAMVVHVGDRAVSVSSQMLALQRRHDMALRNAATQITAAQQLVAGQFGQSALDQPELIAGALREALDELAGLAGRMTPDDIIGRVFATFCIGK